MSPTTSHGVGHPTERLRSGTTGYDFGSSLASVSARRPPLPADQALCGLPGLSFALRNSGQAQAVGVVVAGGRTVLEPVAHRASAGGVVPATAASDALRGSGCRVRQH